VTRVTKCTHSQVVGLRLERALIIIVHKAQCTNEEDSEHIKVEKKRIIIIIAMIQTFLNQCKVTTSQAALGGGDQIH